MGTIVGFIGIILAGVIFHMKHKDDSEVQKPPSSVIDVKTINESLDT